MMGEIKKLTFGIFSTPVQELCSFRDMLGDGKRLPLKRDDLYGIWLGGKRGGSTSELRRESL